MNQMSDKGNFRILLDASLPSISQLSSIDRWNMRRLQCRSILLPLAFIGECLISDIDDRNNGDVCSISFRMSVLEKFTKLMKMQ